MDAPLIGPAVGFPTPWVLGEVRDGRLVVVDANGFQVCQVNEEARKLAALICELVNMAGEGAIADLGPRVSSPHYRPAEAMADKPTSASHLAGLPDRHLLSVARIAVLNMVETKVNYQGDDIGPDYLRGEASALNRVLALIDGLLYQGGQSDG